MFLLDLPKYYNNGKGLSGRTSFNPNIILHTLLGLYETHDVLKIFLSPVYFYLSNTFLWVIGRDTKGIESVSLCVLSPFIHKHKID